MTGKNLPVHNVGQSYLSIATQEASIIVSLILTLVRTISKYRNMRWSRMHGYLSRRAKGYSGNKSCPWELSVDSTYVNTKWHPRRPVSTIDELRTLKNSVVIWEPNSSPSFENPSNQDSPKSRYAIEILKMK